MVNRGQNRKRVPDALWNNFNEVYLVISESASNDYLQLNIEAAVRYETYTTAVQLKSAAIVLPTMIGLKLGMQSAA